MLKIYIFQNIEFFGYGLIDSMLNVFQCVFQQKAFIGRKIIMKPRKKKKLFLACCLRRYWPSSWQTVSSIPQGGQWSPECARNTVSNGCRLYSSASRPNQNSQIQTQMKCPLLQQIAGRGHHCEKIEAQ